MVESYKGKISATAAMTAMALLGVVACATAALGRQGPAQSDEKQVPGYVVDLTDPNPRVRERAADMLGIIGLRIEDATILLPAIERLVALMSDDDMEVRDETAEALGVIASLVKDEAAAVKSAIAALVKGLSDGSGEVREESAEALARIAPTLEDRMLLVPAVGPLVKALEDDPATREFARQALQCLGRPAGDTKTSAPMKLSARDLRRDRYLVLDSRIIESKENVQLTVGAAKKDANNPLFKEDKPWEPRFDNPYCSVIYDDEEKIYKCWYSIFTRSGGSGDFPGEGLPSDKRAWVKWKEGRRGFGVCYATSKDGIAWEKPELGLIEFEGNKRNNIVINAVHGVAVMKDPHETDPEKRYKAIHPFRNHTL
ncbi:MAG: HEAT repeat domain-containing protein, partial [Planctomycetota bacterium]